MIAYNSSTNNVALFLVLILDHNVLDKRGKMVLHHNLFGDKIIQKCFKNDATY